MNVAETERVITRIRVIDLEATGFNDDYTDGVCELGWCDVQLAADGWQVVGGNAVFVDPQRPIPPKASAIHHIIDEDVIGAPPIEEAFAKMMAEQPVVGALVAHSAKSERQWITDEMTDLPWICTYKAALRLWPEEEAHSNQGLRYSRKPVGLDRQVADKSHRAFPDSYVTAFHIRDMLNEGADIEDLIEWATEPALQVYCRISTYRDQRWEDLPTSFLVWVSERDFDEDTLYTVNHHLDLRAEDEDDEYGYEDDEEEGGEDDRPPEDEDDDEWERTGWLPWEV